MQMALPRLDSVFIAVIGLGYVGLPLLIAFNKKYKCIGFDVDKNRITELKNGIDSTKQNGAEDILACRLSDTLSDIAEANVYIVCVPTPVDIHKVPDLSALMSASELVGKVLQKGNIVIYESTTYPTCTENECKNMLERTSSLKCNSDFYLGYSPERVNPSDNAHTLTQIRKITSGSSKEAAAFVDSLYASIITAGTYPLSSIKTAEMTKIIENAQRDLNIAFVNEMCMICDYLDIDAHEVLAAAKTKWNFLPFTPGLVGGHCISIDPYYLIYKMNAIGYHPQVISSGRFINDAMPRFIAQKIITLMAKQHIHILDAHILILGITFKQNCPDIRNSKVPLVKNELESFGAKVSVYDPIASAKDVYRQYHFELISSLPKGKFQAIFLAQAHDECLSLSFSTLTSKNAVFYTLTSHKLKP